MAALHLVSTILASSRSNHAAASFVVGETVSAKYCASSRFTGSTVASMSWVPSSRSKAFSQIHRSSVVLPVPPVPIAISTFDCPVRSIAGVAEGRVADRVAARAADSFGVGRTTASSARVAGSSNIRATVSFLGMALLSFARAHRAEFIPLSVIDRCRRGCAAPR